MNINIKVVNFPLPLINSMTGKNINGILWQFSLLLSFFHPSLKKEPFG